jgi:hypothetical protein|nr:MAG TPA: hypothetical protein [Caudoviricetes sp.]
MSTITKEWLQQKIADMEAIRDDIPFGLGEDGTNTLAALRIALASLEAEPVAWLLSGGGAKNHVSFDSGNAYADPLREVTPLYTAPPAPVSVPDAMEMDDDFDSAFEHGKAVGWNAYRAAMLQGAEPVTTAYKLPPHIYRELVNRLRDTAVKYQGCQQLREQLSRTLQEVIQPVAPQQEVTQALAKGMERYGDAMQKLADSGD